MCLSVPTTDLWPNWILTYFIKISKNFKTQQGSPQESLHMIELICPYNSMWVCHCDLCVSENVAIWPFQIFYWLLIKKNNGLVCHSVPTTDIWPNWILTYFIKISKNFKTQHGSPQESLHMIEFICPYNSMWVCHCDLCGSEKVAILPFQTFYRLLIEKNNGLECHSVPTTDIWPNWILTHFIKISKNFKTKHGSPQESLLMFELICPYNSMWVCHCDLCVSENVAIWPFQIFYWLLIEKN